MDQWVKHVSLKCDEHGLGPQHPYKDKHIWNNTPKSRDRDSPGQAVLRN